MMPRAASLLAALIALLSPISGVAAKDAPQIGQAIRLSAPPKPRGMRDESVVIYAGIRIVMNVSAPTLTPVLPAVGTANGAAVIVAPGGNYSALALDLEGYDEAIWLAEHGVTAFVLSYRLKPRSGDLAAMMKEDAEHPPRPDKRFDAFSPAVEDTQAAIRLVRERAVEWGINPSSVGLMGFSAGARAVIAAATAPDRASRPNFVIPVYGPLQAEAVPAGAPPLYGVIATDDPLFVGTGYGLIDAWRKAGSPIEFHLFERGGHGFGMGKAGTTTMGWIEGAWRWMGMHGFVSSQVKQER